MLINLSTQREPYAGRGGIAGEFVPGTRMCGIQSASSVQWVAAVATSMVVHDDRSADGLLAVSGETVDHNSQLGCVP
jgi:hypothetical protein